MTEPQAPSIPARLAALKQVAEAGLHPWVSIAPMLPINPARLVELIVPYAERVRLDPLNYRRQVQSLFHQQGWHGRRVARPRRGHPGGIVPRLLGAQAREARAHEMS